ncbi:MAG: hypothetical protein ACO21J_10505 [Anaerohalosphaeraceae bacterium]
MNQRCLVLSHMIELKPMYQNMIVTSQLKTIFSISVIIDCCQDHAKKKSAGLPGPGSALRLRYPRSRHPEKRAGMPQFRPHWRYDQDEKKGNPFQKNRFCSH